MAGWSLTDNLHCRSLEPRTSVEDQQRKVAVGTCVSSHAPRIEPCGRLSRTRLPPWVCDGEAIARPGMKDDWFREPVVYQLRHPCPRAPIPLATPPQRAPPEVGDMMPECAADERPLILLSQIHADQSLMKRAGTAWSEAASLLPRSSGCSQTCSQTRFDET